MKINNAYLEILKNHPHFANIDMIIDLKSKKEEYIKKGWSLLFSSFFRDVDENQVAYRLMTILSNDEAFIYIREKSFLRQMSNKITFWASISVLCGSALGAIISNML